MIWDRSTTHPKFDPTGVQTHDLQKSTLHVTETPALTNRPSVTLSDIPMGSAGCRTYISSIRPLISCEENSVAHAALLLPQGNSVGGQDQHEMGTLPDNSPHDGQCELK